MSAPSCVGEQWDRNVAVGAYRAAREAMAETRRNRDVPLTGWVARHFTRDYVFWRGVTLARVARCREAVRVTEARVRAVMETV